MRLDLASDTHRQQFVQIKDNHSCTQINADIHRSGLN